MVLCLFGEKKIKGKGNNISGNNEFYCLVSVVFHLCYVLGRIEESHLFMFMRCVKFILSIFVCLIPTNSEGQIIKGYHP